MGVCFATISYVGTQVTVLVLFVDIRGFTSWSENNEVASSLDLFIEGFDDLLRASFPHPDFVVKSLGDGDMIVQTIPPNLRGEDLDRLITDALTRALKFEAAFGDLCTTFAESVGQPADLLLGWGITRGHVKEVRGDFYGSNANKAARLCDLARPSGFALSKPDFPRPPKVAGLVFVEQARVLRGLGQPEPVWITTDAARDHLPREKLRETPEVHVTGVCIDHGPSGLKILMARRATGRSLYPDRWEGCGGQLKRNESFSEGVARHFRAEMGIKVDVLEALHCFYAINEANHPFIPGIRFLCKVRGERTPTWLTDRHSEVQWISEDELRALPECELIPSWRNEVLELLERYKAAGAK